MKVLPKKLGREKVWGQADSSEKVIEIDPRIEGKKYLEILIHEAMHILNEEWPESKVVKQSKRLTNLLWRENFRKVDNRKGPPLQDG